MENSNLPCVYLLYERPSKRDRSTRHPSGRAHTLHNIHLLPREHQRVSSKFLIFERLSMSSNPRNVPQPWLLSKFPIANFHFSMCFVSVAKFWVGISEVQPVSPVSSSLTPRMHQARHLIWLSDVVSFFFFSCNQRYSQREHPAPLSI